MEVFFWRLDEFDEMNKIQVSKLKVGQLRPLSPHTPTERKKRKKTCRHKTKTIKMGAHN